MWNLYEKSQFKSIYGLFCKDNYLYHILVSKYNINKEIILNNELIIEYHNIIYDNTIF